MINKFLLCLVIPLLTLGCNGQKGNSSDSKNETNNPQKNIVVNKKYDEKGNLIQYDSTYSSFYSNANDSSMRDSSFREFKNYFNQNFSFSDEPFFDKFFFPDSLLMNNFYKKNFFYDRFKSDMARMDSLFRHMDNMKNDYFRNQVEQGKSK